MTNTEEYLTELYGAVTDSTYHSYYKYEFTVTLTTAKGYTIRASYGGDHNDIYRFSLEDITWADIEDSGRVDEVLSSPS